MKTNANNKSKSLLLSKASLKVLVGSLLFLSISFGPQKFSNNRLSSDERVEQNLKLDKKSYLASEFLQYKKQNLKCGIYGENLVSEIVLFRAFVKSEKEKVSE